MAPAVQQSHGFLAKRYCNNYGYNSYGDDDDCYSTWNSWGRWVALAVIVVAVLLIAFLFSCFNNRRRRRMGAQPMYGTAWMPGSKPPAYGQHNQYGPAAPPYSAQPMPNQATGTTFNSNEGYYGQHNGGGGAQYEMQPPANVYQPQREQYEAPVGPPPGKDGVIR
ncbi:Protein RCR2 [Lachnellula suecica]|uniref:Protein RCR2 n=1 Tax=Lachnellula suecica TaxID=602035 RepID=A0A8T9CD82_9HELO|nr:Protein RCR2 [Lachnellula suecica]